MNTNKPMTHESRLPMPSRGTARQRAAMKKKLLERASFRPNFIGGILITPEFAAEIAFNFVHPTCDLLDLITGKKSIEEIETLLMEDLPGELLFVREYVSTLRDALLMRQLWQAHHAAKGTA